MKRPIVADFNKGKVCDDEDIDLHRRLVRRQLCQGYRAATSATANDSSLGEQKRMSFPITLIAPSQLRAQKSIAD
ncbi:hypothetical protein PY365_01715 [Roseiarcaceae bacterium H3SJ34-1]|uniref:hypothetical protein n=1 Tax=Terripilifer ovatus TaxID=3032367 RepID=UPI003AB936A7|nr:hypothetical protein [Roseiarcaceae bacterium H3SJ34-1]